MFNSNFLVFVRIVSTVFLLVFINPLNGEETLLIGAIHSSENKNHVVFRNVSYEQGRNIISAIELKDIHAHYISDELKSLTNSRAPFLSPNANGWELKLAPSDSSSLQDKKGSSNEDGDGDSSGAGNGGANYYWESCDSEVSNHVSYLTTPSIAKVPSASNFHIKISFLVWCDLTASNCNEDKLRGQVMLENGKQKSFDIQISQSHRGSARSLRPPFPPYSTALPIDELLDSESSSFSLRFSDEGLCIRISGIEIYSLFCPEEIRDHTSYVKTFAPQDPWKTITVTGRCVLNSSPDPEMHLMSTQRCTGYGQWDNPFSTCQCNPGYHSNKNKTGCERCGAHTYKSEFGNAMECKGCPPNSDAYMYALSMCHCYSGHFRNMDQESADTSCAKQPSAPRNALFEAEFTTVAIRWTPPEDNGGRELVWYRIDCFNCGENGETIIEDKIRQPVFTLIDLKPGHSYNVSIYALNSVSKYFYFKSHTTITVRTRDAVMPEDVKITNEGNGRLKVSWTPPDKLKYGPVETYCVRISGGGVQDTIMLGTNRERQADLPRCVNGTELILQNLEKGLYGIEVGVLVSPNLPIFYSKKQFANVEDGAQMISTVTQKQLLLVIGMMSMICFLFILLCSCAVFMYKRQNNNAHAFVNNKQYSLCDYGTNQNGMNVSTFLAPFTPNGQSPNNPLLVNSGCTVVDSNLVVPIGQAFKEPGFYDDLNLMVSDFCQFIDPNQVEPHTSHPKEFLCTVGENSLGFLKPVQQMQSKAAYQNTINGNFCSNEYSLNRAAEDVPVFIKSVSTWSPELRRVAIEASTMSQFFHPNVQLIHGIACTESSWSIVCEIGEAGHLAGFMGAVFSASIDPNQESIKPREMMTQFVHILRGISCGMQYLSDVGYVHKVLTSSNVKLNSNLVCKISGFEQRVTLDECNPAHNEDCIKLMDFLTPWSAPEVLKSGKYSSASDAWSFGIIGWELMNCISISINGITSSIGPGGNETATIEQLYALNATATTTQSAHSTLRCGAPAPVPIPLPSIVSPLNCEHLGATDHHETYTTSSNNSTISPSHNAPSIRTGRGNDDTICEENAPSSTFTSALVPYSEMTRQEICHFLSKGLRLPLPPTCPQQIAHLISRCWLNDRTHRPYFYQLREELESFIRQPSQWGDFMNNSGGKGDEI